MSLSRLQTDARTVAVAQRCGPRASARRRDPGRRPLRRRRLRGAPATRCTPSPARAASALVAAHLDHGLRPDSAARCGLLRRPVPRAGRPAARRARRRPGPRGRATAAGIEEAARLRALRVPARRFASRKARRWIVLAHTRDDQAETVLLRLLRGVGQRRPRRHARRARATSCARCWRVSRQDVLDHLAARGLSWREDPTNADPAFLRNRVRHELIPYLESRFNPAVREALARTAVGAGGRGRAAGDHRRGASAAAQRGRRGDPPARRRVARGPAGGGADRGPACRSRRRAACAGWPSITWTRSSTSPRAPAASGRRLPLPGGREAAVHFDEIRIGPRRPARAALRRRARRAGRASPLPGRPLGRGARRLRPARGRRGGGRASPPARSIVRTRRPGDRVRSAGREMSLKRFLMDRRVPAADRDRLPLVASGRTVLWVRARTWTGRPASRPPRPAERHPERGA